jgi:hypothetical protein
LPQSPGYMIFPPLLHFPPFLSFFRSYSSARVVNHNAFSFDDQKGKTTNTPVITRQKKNFQMHTHKMARLQTLQSSLNKRKICKNIHPFRK